MSRLPNQLKLTIDKSKAPKVGLACEVQTLEILGQKHYLTLETMSEIGKLFCSMLLVILGYPHKLYYMLRLGLKLRNHPLQLK